MADYGIADMDDEEIDEVIVAAVATNPWSQVRPPRSS